jgi:phosphatidylinositol alpha-mannosyltransferase
LVIDAFDQLRDPSVTLDIFGQGMNELEEDVKRRGIPHVTFHGSVTNVAERLREYDVYLAPSKGGEGFSLSLLEAMNAGLPVVASDIMPFREALDDAGIYFGNNDVTALVRAIREVKTNPGLLADKPAAILARAGLFSYEAFRSKVRHLYEVEEP